MCRHSERPRRYGLAGSSPYHVAVKQPVASTTPRYYSPFPLSALVHYNVSTRNCKSDFSWTLGGLKIISGLIDVGPSSRPVGIVLGFPYQSSSQLHPTGQTFIGRPLSGIRIEEASSGEGRLNTAVVLCLFEGLSARLEAVGALTVLDVNEL